MGTSNSTRRSSSKKQGTAFGGGNSLRHQAVRPEKDEALPSYRKPELQDFECVICKDLVYKPVVNACGHGFFCFWCAHESMGAGFQSSMCPMCRSTFSHMPRVCELAHSYLTKTWPVEYGARAAEVEAEERQRNMFSPEPIGLPQHFGGMLQQLDDSLSNGNEGHGKGTVTNEQQLMEHTCKLVEGGGTSGDSHLAACAGVEMQPGGAKKEELSVGDCECLLCHKLLFQPVVLSCGHAYCFLCLEERFPGTPVTCAYCQKAHLEDEVAVCGQLQEVIQGAFPHETHCRIVQERARMGNRKGLLKRVSASDQQSTVPKGFVHFGIECDACGVYPIVGERYQCQDCEEEIGFDLCGQCHAGREQPMLGSYLFKQKHLPQHTMHRVEPIPTFLHQVMDTHPELSVSTVINMVMSMAEDMADDPPTNASPPVEEEVFNLAETGLFDEPQAATAAQGAVLSLGDLPPAAGGDDTEGGEPLDADSGGGEGVTQAGNPGPLDLTPRLVRTVLALAEEEQAAAQSAQATEPGREMAQQPGPVVDASPPQPAEEALAESGGWTIVESGDGRTAEVPRAQRESRNDPLDTQSVVFDGSRERAGVEPGETQSEGVVGAAPLEHTFTEGENGIEGPQREEPMQVIGSEGLRADTWQQSGAVQGALQVPADSEENSSRTVVSHGRGCVSGVDNASRVGSERDQRSQPGGVPQIEIGRGRPSMEERRATLEHQQRASCEPGLRRTDSYHQLMMASA